MIANCNPGPSGYLTRTQSSDGIRGSGNWILLQPRKSKAFRFTGQTVPVYGMKHTAESVPPNCYKLTNLTAAVYWNRFVRLAEQFLNKLFTAEMMKERVDYWAKIIEPMMKDDPFLEHETWINGVEALRGNMESLPKDFDDYIHSAN